MKNQHELTAREVAAMGGRATARKLGKNGMRELAMKRWRKEKRLKKLSIPKGRKTNT